MNRATAGSVERRRQYMNPRSRTSGLSTSSVAHFNTLGTSSPPAAGRLRKSLTVAVRRANRTSGGSSRKEYRKSSNSSSLFSIRSAYSPTIQIMAAFASGSVERIQILAERRDDAFVLVRIFAEDVLDHDDGLLHDIADLRLDESEESSEAAFRRRLNFDVQSPKGPDRFPGEVHIDLRRIFDELSRELAGFFGRGESIYIRACLS
ncbi:hypothetical protein CF319_g685 [Tilletia indica]|nr:hypothetical protein CF319_g685 [Tilletia indica]